MIKAISREKASKLVENLYPLTIYRKLLKALNELGFRIVHQKGSHIYLTDGKHKITVPRHRVIKKGTLLAILQQAGLTREEFLKLLK